MEGISMANKPGIIHRLFTGFWNLVDQGRRSIINILFLLIIYVIIKGVFFAEIKTVHTGSALVINPMGYIVDELDHVEPIDEMFDELSDRDNKPPQTLLKEVIEAIDSAATDTSIDAIVLKLGGLYGAGPSKLHDISLALEEFKATGKPVYAYSQFFNQSQYIIAAQADEVYMDPLGSVYIEGYGRFNTYFKGALDNLGINFHIFKVGTFKSAVEPFLRNDMSDEAKQANLHYLGDLWDDYTESVASARELEADDIKQYSNQYLSKIGDSTTKPSQLAVEASLVDGLMTRQEIKSYLIEKIGSNKTGKNYRQISYKNYLDIITSPDLLESSLDKVAVVVAKGVIYNGKKKAGAIGGISTADQIRRARVNESVKAMVLRVDSPGGSAFASEMIRREIVAMKEAGKPVVISMGSYAASGGYWISASADEIWASPTTVTGSIGIFGMLPTFEGPLNKYGIHRDGVGTTLLSGAFDAGKPLREDVGNAIQGSIEKGYEQFLSIVAEGRDMNKEEVDKIAQGRVWSGKTAKEIGLVDFLGDIDDAINSAAVLADLDTYEIKYIGHKLSDSEQFFNSLFKSSIISAIQEEVVDSEEIQARFLSPAVLLMNELKSSYQMLSTMDDPNNIYAHCLCSVN